MSFAQPLAADTAPASTMRAPSLETIGSILNKETFAAEASKAGLAVVPSWCPRDDKDLEALAPTLPYPILIKPRTHVHRLRNDKGVVVRSADQLIRQYRLFLDREQYRAARNPISPDANRPVLQQFEPSRKLHRPVIIESRQQHHR